MVCPHGQGRIFRQGEGGQCQCGWANADIFRQGEGVNFSRFCTDVFHRRPLMLKN